MRWELVVFFAVVFVGVEQEYDPTLRAKKAGGIFKQVGVDINLTILLLHTGMEAFQLRIDRLGPLLLLFRRFFLLLFHYYGALSRGLLLFFILLLLLELGLLFLAHRLLLFTDSYFVGASSYSVWRIAYNRIEDGLV